MPFNGNQILMKIIKISIIKIIEIPNYPKIISIPLKYFLPKGILSESTLRHPQEHLWLEVLVCQQWTFDKESKKWLSILMAWAWERYWFISAHVQISDHLIKAKGFFPTVISGLSEVRWASDNRTQDLYLLFELSAVERPAKQSGRRS